jgi:hypothetical protein
LELDIDAIHVTVTSDSEGDEDKEEIARTIYRHILEAMEDLSRSEPATRGEYDAYLDLDLREIDWESEPDKTGKIVQLLREALEGVQ